MTAESQQEIETVEPALLEAMAWLARAGSGAMSDMDMAALKHWRARTPEHDRAFEMVQAFQTAALAMPKSAQIMPFPKRATSRRAFLVGGSAIAASVAGFMVVRPPLGLWPSLADLMSDHRTGIGERLAFSPAAGVQFEMNTRTSVSLENHTDSVRIIDGEAFVQVADRSADFKVITTQGTLSTRGGRFNVRTLGHRLSVACVSGQVACDADKARTILQTGDQLAVSDAGQQHTKADMETVMAWRRGLLIFRGTPLSDVVAEINRYRGGRIILADADVGKRPVIGIFHTAHIENTVNQIRQLLAVSMMRLPGGVVLIG
ncbi:MAG TPA: FecR domain-containing protein [Rhizomicrobium sp.]|jgi:transmembrane sensor